MLCGPVKGFIGSSSIGSLATMSAFKISVYVASRNRINTRTSSIVLGCRTVARIRKMIMGGWKLHVVSWLIWARAMPLTMSLRDMMSYVVVVIIIEPEEGVHLMGDD